jgi:hypothetical protein
LDWAVRGVDEAVKLARSLGSKACANVGRNLAHTFGCQRVREAEVSRVPVDDFGSDVGRACRSRNERLTEGGCPRVSGAHCAHDLRYLALCRWVACPGALYERVGDRVRRLARAGVEEAVSGNVGRIVISA